MKQLLNLLLASIAFVLPCSCGKSGVGEISLSVPEASLGWEAGSQSIGVQASGDWTLDFEFGVTETPWARVDRNAGKDSAQGITLSWDANPSTDMTRYVRLTLHCGSKSTSVSLTQAKAGEVTVLKSDPVQNWLELPATNNASLYFIFRDEMTLASGAKCRNYAYYYDRDARVALWVAYPLNRSLRGSGSRSDAWGLDPKVPKADQAVLFRGYGNSKTHDRGHQIPSADRYLSGTNEMTYYGTNMTPQLHGFNGGVWSSLETKVRNWSDACDTLYVVTGCDLTGATATTIDNENKTVRIPSGYFKALLAYKKSGDFGSGTGSYIGVGFYFEHKDYADTMDTIKAQSLTLDDLEKKLGYDLFVNLPDDTQKVVEARVPNWWWTH